MSASSLMTDEVTMIDNGLTVTFKRTLAATRGSHQVAINTTSPTMTSTSAGIQVVNAATLTVTLPPTPISGDTYEIGTRNQAYTLAAAVNIYFGGGAAALTQAIPSTNNLLTVVYDGAFWLAK